MSPHVEPRSRRPFLDTVRWALTPSLLVEAATYPPG
jgi:hypothetical protein